MSATLITISLIILFRNGLAKGGMETDLGSMFLPRIIAVFILLFSGTIGAQALLALHRHTPLTLGEHIDTTGFMGVGIYFGIFILYWLLAPHLGFLVTTPGIVFAIAYLLGGRCWWKMAAVAMAITLLISYGCSEYLRVYLPTWSLS